MSLQSGIGQGVSLIGAGTKNLGMQSYLQRKERMLQEAAIPQPPPRATSKEYKAKVSSYAILSAFLQQIMANPNSLMNRSKSLADKKNAIDKK